MEKTEEDDLFAALREELCGKAYYHGQKGRGTIRAACEGHCMIAYTDGETETLTVGQMYDRRRVLPGRTQPHHRSGKAADSDPSCRTNCSAAG